MADLVAETPDLVRALVRRWGAALVWRKGSRGQPRPDRRASKPLWRSSAAWDLLAHPALPQGAAPG